MFKLFLYEYKIKKYNFYKFLVIASKSLSGRSQQGIITHNSRGGSLKKYYRLIDFYRYLKNNIACFISRFEYDPNRNVSLMLLIYINGICVYVLTPNLVKIYDLYLLQLFKIGENLLVFFGFSGMFSYNVQYVNYKKAQLGRSAGSFVILLRKIGDYVLFRLKSKEELFLLNNIYLNIGRISGELNKLFKYIKAGNKRHLGFKSKVRGVAKNPIDHPHGGGSGRTTAGRPSVTPQGFYTKGIKTTKRQIKKKKFFLKKELILFSNMRALGYKGRSIQKGAFFFLNVIIFE